MILSINSLPTLIFSKSEKEHSGYEVNATSSTIITVKPIIAPKVAKFVFCRVETQELAPQLLQKHSPCSKR